MRKGKRWVQTVFAAVAGAAVAGAAVVGGAWAQATAKTVKNDTSAEAPDYVDGDGSIYPKSDPRQTEDKP